MPCTPRLSLASTNQHCSFYMNVPLLLTAFFPVCVLYYFKVLLLEISLLCLFHALAMHIASLSV